MPDGQASSVRPYWGRYTRPLKQGHMEMDQEHSTNGAELHGSVPSTHLPFYVISHGVDFVLHRLYQRVELLVRVLDAGLGAGASGGLIGAESLGPVIETREGTLEVTGGQSQVNGQARGQVRSRHVIASSERRLNVTTGQRSRKASPSQVTSRHTERHP